MDGYDHHNDLIRESGKCLIGRHDTDADRDEQRSQGNDVVAPAIPNKEGQHGDDDGYRQRLTSGQAQ